VIGNKKVFLLNGTKEGQTCASNGDLRLTFERQACEWKEQGGNDGTERPARGKNFLGVRHLLRGADVPSRVFNACRGGKAVILRRISDVFRARGKKNMVLTCRGTKRKKARTKGQRKIR